MKMFKSFALLLLTSTILSSAAFASTEPPIPLTEKDELRAEIVKLIESTNMEKLDAKAKVSFMVTTKNEIVVLYVRTAEKSLDRMIKSRLNYKKVKTDIKKKNQVYFVDLIFKKI